MLHIVIRTIAIIVTSYITKVGVVPVTFSVKTFFVAFLVAVTLAIINHTIKPIIKIISIPINVITLGAFSLVINGLTIVIASRIVTDFYIPSLLMAIWFSVVLTIVNFILHVAE